MNRVRFATPKMRPSFLLLSIDLEDVRDYVPGGMGYRARVPAITSQLLELFRAKGAHITFFVTGQVAERYPSLLSEIVSEGHELACHTYWHRPLERYSEAEFSDDLGRNIEVLTAAGGKFVQGFRAPTLSMTPRTTWVYRVLAAQGIKYSSSVLPARNPLYGWPEFGQQPKLVDGVLEIPVTVGRVLHLKVPFSSGIYFRALPAWIICRQAQCVMREGRPVVSYIHPYDFDADQERFTHPELKGSRFYNFLMYYNRATAFDKLRQLTKIAGAAVCSYERFIAATTPPGNGA
jgi:polysaccharide deacetylase family protein (PEP-CTERM system associated)